MTIDAVPSNVDLVALEREILAFWSSADAFGKLAAMRRGGPKWHFLDGPITANNAMGVHHAWGRTYKDVWQRFKAMQGHELRWQNGFDCQGLWVEVNVEKELGLETKRDIESIGVANFIIKCKQRVLTYAAELTRQSVRLGMWMDWNDPATLLQLREALGGDPFTELTIPGPEGPVTDTAEALVGHLGAPKLGGSYFTFSDENNYAIWNFIKKCWENGWIYRGTDVMPWCTRCGTGLSQHEIATDGYEDLTHESVYLTLPLRERQNTALLVWTTTPWTLPANVLAAVNPDATYAEAVQGDQTYILAASSVSRVLRGPYTIVREYGGEELVGLTYDGPFDEIPIVQEYKIPAAHSVVAWKEVSEDEGTGIVHISPGSGAEDFVLGKEYGVPILAPLTEDGSFIDGFGWLAGKSVHDSAPEIFEQLRSKGTLYRTEPITHRYPVCWRCRTELVFRLVDEWFISMGPRYDKPRDELTPEEKKSSLRYQIMDVAEPISWVPAFGHDRELEWLYQMDDWMISKKRYWGLALPIWTCSGCDHFEVIGSKAELADRAVEGWADFAGHSPHRPFVDKVMIACEKCGALMSRIPDVGNPWLDAGIVPFATLRHGSDRDYFERWFPADFITESFPGQFRNWFYAVLAMSTVLENRTPYNAVLGYALLVAEDGRPMHKSWGNAISFDEAADRIGADLMRWMFCVHPPERNLPFGYSLANQARRFFFNTFWNVYSFFCNYASIERWQPDGDVPSTPPGQLDRWIITRLDQVIEEMTSALEAFSSQRATAAVSEFIDDLSNWYVRRSRRRFWQPGESADKSHAYATLYHVLTTLTQLLAPITPFMTEAMHQNLRRSVDDAAPPSVHHLPWPGPSREDIDQGLLDDMALVRTLANLGHNARDQVRVKVRQPLSRAVVVGCDRGFPPELTALLADELNVKEIVFSDSPAEVLSLRIEPDIAYWGPRLKKRLPDLRAALEHENSGEAAAALAKGTEVALTLDDGGQIVLRADNSTVISEPRPGYVVVSGNDGLVVALATDIPHALRLEGLAREVVRRIQTLRKDANLRIDDRIEITWKAEGGLAAAIAEFADYIRGETLGLSLTQGEPASLPGPQFSGMVDGQKLAVAISKAGELHEKP